MVRGSCPAYLVASTALLDLNRLDESRAMAQRAVLNGVDSPYIHWPLLTLAYAEGDAQMQQRETEWLASHEAQPIALLEQGNNAAALGRLKQAKELFRKGSDLPGLPIAFRQEFLARAATADALFGKCAPLGSSGPPIALAVCDPQRQGSSASNGPRTGLRRSRNRRPMRVGWRCSLRAKH